VDVWARALRVFRVEMPPPLARDADGPDGRRSNEPPGARA